MTAGTQAMRYPVSFGESDERMELIMPAYYNPYMSAYPTNYWNPINPMTISSQMAQPVVQQPQYMINVDGENSAKAWQPTTPVQPNTIIPLFDSDGQHVYFKTYDAYGRMNPLRKGRIVFDDEVAVEPVKESSTDMSIYVTKDDLSKMKEELEETLRYHLGQVNKSMNQNNQNGSNNRGEKR